jgi:ATP-dependent exoDNAse (exonuclease V) beta subunit
VPEEIPAAAQAVSAALGHPLLRRAAQAWRRGDCRRETPVTLRGADGAWLEGVVDLAFREEQRWTVIDFKTDHDIAHGLETYRHQVALYADAIEAATTERAQAVLLLV